MNNDLYTWLAQYVRFDSVKYKSSPKDLVVDLFISDKCNLRCKHCYFGNTNTIGSILTSQEWKELINSLYAIGVRHFHISGRESSLDNRIIDIVSYIKDLEGTFSGLVSNGTGQLQFYKDIINVGVDYLEFSIDGTENTHNYIRGKNVFSQTTKLLGSLSQHSNIIDISTCLNKNSLDEYFALIDICMDYGIKKFFATPFIIKGNGESFGFFSISPLVFSQLIENSFKYLESKSGQKIALRYCVPHEMTFQVIEDSDFFRNLLVSYLSDKSNLTYSINGNIIQISLNLLDIKFLNNISITSDGEVIPCSDYISDNNYPRFSLGNVLKTDIITISQKRIETINKFLNSFKDENRCK